MPGILPMKMIRVGSTNQSRIAQACDRCRSKKIRCDGVRPCCTQCANVGFECKTSDKLSRRAFPRGYTESLEDRVRALEAEVRELKELLDEKDEKLDMLSRLHSFSPASRKPSASLSPASAAQVKAEVTSSQEEVLHVEIPAPVTPSTTSTGTSSTAGIIEAFEGKIQEKGRPCPPIASSTLLAPPAPALKSSAYSSTTSVAPPRLLSDQYINLFFQEWQPLLPVLHRQTFLRVYEQFLGDTESRLSSSNKPAFAQLFLIFEIAAHSASSKAKPNTTAYELQWRKALSSVSSTPSLATLQCQVLAQLCYLLKGDHPHLLRHRAYAVSICHQLGLHQGHKCLSLPAFEAETRKKVFWCQYVLDKFTSAVTGMPTLLRDSDISAEYPADVDDENISAEGFSPALPGELTKISSALALFRLSRILAKTLDHLYPSKATYRISLNKLHSLSDELDQWHEELPDHLRLRFCNDKPATNLISDRSPLLSLAYFYARSLIHRPLLCHGSGSAASAATIVLAAAAKHILQIVDLLDERCMNYTFPVNKQDVLINAGFSILWQCIDLEEDSKLVKDNQKSLMLLLAKLGKENLSSGNEFEKVAASFIPLSRKQTPPKYVDLGNPASELLSGMPAPAVNKAQKSTRKQLHAIASRFSNLSTKSKGEEDPRRTASMQAGLASSMSPNLRANSTISLASTQSAPAMQLCTPSPRITTPHRPSGDASSVINLDYFPLGDTFQCMQTQNSSTTMLPPKKQSPMVSNNGSWEHLVANLDTSISEGFTTVSPYALNKTISNSESLDWSNEMWQMAAYDLNSPKANVPQSLLSFSEESMASGDDFVFSAPGSHNGSLSTTDGIDLRKDETFKGIAMPVSSVEDELDFHHDLHA